MRGILNKQLTQRIIFMLLAYAIVQLLVSTNIINAYLQATLVTICINIILAVSLNLITGFTQFSWDVLVITGLHIHVH